MKEIRDIVAAYAQAREEGLDSALATVISVEGSSYRRAGARMLITETGTLTGAISGGCLEGDALRKAKLVMERNAPKLVRYDTNDEDDAQLGLGLGCNGIIDVLIEPLLPNDPGNPLLLLEQACSRRTRQVLVTHASRGHDPALQGTCLLLADASTPTGIGNEFLAAAEHSLREGQSQLIQTDDGVLFCELLEPELRVMIFGAGNDAQPVLKLSAVLGWETHIIDGRPAYLTAARFGGASALHLLKVDAATLPIEADARTVAVLMSHNYNYDIAMLRLLLPQHVPYIGVLGPRRKLVRMLGEPGLDTTEIPENVYGPTGLDIGAATPEEIALSIVSEIQSVIAKRSGTSLRERRQPIHAG
jgi:xanthine/CO dehydrogenase XdhC/CoxF family maturation factor